MMSIMRRDSRISVALHVLLHMHEGEGPVTSETLGPKMDLNPVVLRRTLAGLRDAKIVRSEKGHGGGWSLARPLDDVTVADVYDALGRPALFGVGPRAASPGCLVEQVVDRCIDEALGEAEAIVLARLRRLRVADLVDEFRQRSRQAKKKGNTCTTSS
jgi:DNA-binding IscR family transcriptional regulator